MPTIAWADDCTAALAQAGERLRQLRAHPVIDVERELAALERFVTDFRARLRADKEKHPTQAIAQALERLTNLFQGRVGEQWQTNSRYHAATRFRVPCRRLVHLPGPRRMSVQDSQTAAVGRR